MEPSDDVVPAGLATADDATSTVGVVLIDDHQMFTESLSRLLQAEGGIAVLGVATTAAEGLDLVARCAPQVVLVDYQLPDEDGVVVTSEIKRRNPTTMVVMLTGSADDRVMLDAIEAGCSGFLTKAQAAGDVVAAVRAAAVGEALVSSDQLARLLPRLRRSGHSMRTEFTERELEVLALVARGLANKAIARELHLSVNTIRNYVQAILRRLDAHSKLEAVAAAVREGVIELPRS